MFHAISAAWARLERWITALGTVPSEPRYGHLGTDRSWGQAAIAERISALGIAVPGEPIPCRFCQGTGEQYYNVPGGVRLLAACGICGNGQIGSKGTGVITPHGRGHADAR
jgi:hypothetical protein